MCTKSAALRRANERIQHLDNSYLDVSIENRDLLDAITYIHATTTDVETMHYANLILDEYGAIEH